jgi:hypothetical protein
MRHSRGLLPLTVVASELTLGATAYEGRARRQPSLKQSNMITYEQ